MIGCECEVCRSDNPRDQRLRSSVWIQSEGHSIVIDTGPDFRTQMLRYGVKRLDAVLFTHEHKDHVAGLDDIRAYNHLQQMPIPVYAERRVHRALRKEFAYIFARFKYPGVPDVKPETISGKPFNIGPLHIDPIRGYHYKLPVYGFRFGRMAYIVDLNLIDEKEKKKLYDLDHLVVTALRKTPHLSHFSLSDALALINEVKPRHAWLTHISHMLGLYDVVVGELPENVHLAYDGLTIESV